MFENAGGKLKVVAVVLFVLEVIAAVITGIVYSVNAYEGGFLLFLLITGGGILGAYLTSLVLYAIGEAAENSNDVEKKEQLQKRKN